MGGIRINENMEVLDKKNAVIPGLYAGGFDAGGMYGDSYPITASQGLSSAFALNSGRIAGQKCARVSADHRSRERRSLNSGGMLSPSTPSTRRMSLWPDGSKAR